MELSGVFEYCNVFYSLLTLSFPFIPSSSWVFAQVQLWQLPGAMGPTVMPSPV